MPASSVSATAEAPRTVTVMPALPVARPSVTTPVIVPSGVNASVVATATLASTVTEVDSVPSRVEGTETETT